MPVARLCTDDRSILSVAACALFLTLAAASTGCSRKEYRHQADHDAYSVIDERNDDPRWQQDDVSIEIDPRSRFFDPYDPDESPMPEDDPTSHQYMHLVNGIEGWDHWHDNGGREALESAGWREMLGGYVTVTEDGAVRLDMPSALRLAYVHSPNHQTQLEALYLSALDVTRERFLLDTQFFGGYGLGFSRRGRLTPGGESSGLALGRPQGGAFTARRTLAAGGNLVVDFANSFVFEFAGGDLNFAQSFLNVTLMQPLLRNAGRYVQLEGLTRFERDLLAKLRAYAQFRQGFYTQVAIGELGVVGPQGSGGTFLQSFAGSQDVSGFLGLLRQVQELRNAEDNLNLQLRTREQLEFRLNAGTIDLVQVNQIRQSVESARVDLLRRTNEIQAALDRYKKDILGLPPDLPIELDDALIAQFRLIPRGGTALLNSIIAQQIRVGELPENAEGELTDEVTVELIQELLADGDKLIEPVQEQLEKVPTDLEHMDEVGEVRKPLMDELQLKLYVEDRELLDKNLTDLRTRFRAAPNLIKMLRDGLKEDTRDETVAGLTDFLRTLRRIVERSVLVQAAARLESVTVDPIALEAPEALQIALANRLDFMNGRAALVDSWRLIQVRANALQSDLSVTANAQLNSARDNPISFRSRASTMRLGLEFDAPITRLEERNEYRSQLIAYQRSRRGFIQSRDSLNLGIRALLRLINQLRTEFEIQRRALTIAIRQVDLTQAELDAPVPPRQPGAPASQFRPTTALNVISATQNLQRTQNSFLQAWLRYYATRMRLVREMGIMQLGDEGEWIDEPVPASIEELLERGGTPIDAGGLNGTPPLELPNPAPPANDPGAPPAAENPANEQGIATDTVNQEQADFLIPPPLPSQWVKLAQAVGNGDRADATLEPVQLPEPQRLHPAPAAQSVLKAELRRRSFEQARPAAIEEPQSHSELPFESPVRRRETASPGRRGWQKTSERANATNRYDLSPKAR